MNHYASVKAFFERNALRYRSRPRAFRAYYFGHRLAITLAEMPTQGVPHLLDIGCGQGEIFSALYTAGRSAHYLGIDISPAMLALSDIPADQQLVTTLEDGLQRGNIKRNWEVVVGLGLTTYYREEDLAEFYRAISEILDTDGQAIISYTHSASLDYRFRRSMHWLLGRLLPKGRSLGRDFPIFATEPKALENDLPATLKLEKLIWLPAAIPLLTHWFPRWSVQLSKGLLAKCSPLWRGDFVAVIRRC